MADDWSYAQKGERFGPVPPAKVKSLAEQGWLTPGDLVWGPALPDWQPAGRLTGCRHHREDAPGGGGATARGTPAGGPRLVPAGHYGPGEQVMVINHPPVQRWSPGLAAVLSVLLPGLGQIDKGQIIIGIPWFFLVAIGYAALFLPGLVLHFCCIVGAASGNPWTAGRTEVVRA